MDHQSPALKIPLQDTSRLYSEHAAELQSAVTSAMESGWWLNGSRNAAFAREFAAFIGTSACIPVANGTDALEIAMRALISVRAIAGTEVVTVANAGGYTSTAVHQLGLTPVYVDIDPGSQLLDSTSLVSALGPKTAMIVLTHLYGGAVNVPSIRREIDAAGFAHVPIIEDCAQAHGAMIGDKRVGSFGDVATFSFYPTKNLGAMGDGGAVLTSDDQIAQAVRQLHQYGWSEKYQISFSGGRNSRMDEMQAAVLSVLLPYLDTMNRRRQQILARYEESAPSAITPVRADESVAHLAVFLARDRDRFRRHCLDRGIITDIHYPVLDCDQTGWQHLSWRVAPHGLANSRKSIRSIVTLPCFPSMTNEEVDRVCEALQCYQ